MNSKLKSALNIALDVLLVLFMVFSIIVLVISLSQKTENPGDKPSHLFGFTIRSVASDSMEPHHEDGSAYKADNGFYKGDLIICKITKDNETYSVGDTVMFWMAFDSNNQQCNPAIYATKRLTTHEIVRIEEQPDGEKLYYTQGLNRQAGKNLTEDIVPKTADEFVAKYEGTRIAKVGSVIDFIQHGTDKMPWLGFFLCVLLPILIFVIIQAIRVIRNFVTYKAQKAAVAAASGELTEEQKRLIAEEYMKTLNTSNSPETAPEKQPEEDEEISSEETEAESPEQTQE